MEMTFRRTNITNTPFDNPHIRKILDREIDLMMTKTKGKMLGIDPFARESFTTKNESFMTNDLNPEFNNLHYNLEFKDYIQFLRYAKGDFLF